MEKSAEIDVLRTRVEQLEKLLLEINDAAFGMAGIFGRALVEAGLISRDGLADIIESRAGNTGAGDHNTLLRTFARSVRMNFPGGSFEIISGGKVDDG